MMNTKNMGRAVGNRHKVPKHQWAKWSNFARRTFNEMYYSLRPNMQFAFLHPDALATTKEHWGVTRWNVAWTAASIANNEGRMGAVVQDGKTYVRMPTHEKARKRKTLATLRGK